MKFSDAAAQLAGLVPRLLGWSPDAFWNATPAELAAILAPTPDSEPLARSELETLMERDCDG
jgi:uncharacterized phage protein (TIGR02216 family)